MDQQRSSAFGRGWIPASRDIGLPGEEERAFVARGVARAGQVPLDLAEVGPAPRGGEVLAPLPFRGNRRCCEATAAGGGGCPEPLAMALVDMPHPNPSPEGEGLLVRYRSDGWTAERRRAFLEGLAECGSVAAACARVGMSAASAYALRRRGDARGFAQAWDAARALAAEHLVDVAWDRAVNGELRQRYYHDQLVGETRHYDNRLLLALIAQNRALAERAAEESAGGSQGARAAASPALVAAVAADWDAALLRAETGEALPEPEGVSWAQVVATSAASAYAGDPGDEADDRAEDGADDEGDDEGDELAALLADDPDLAERIAQCGYWWDARSGKYRTDWPPPPGLAGGEGSEAARDECVAAPAGSSGGEAQPRAPEVAACAGRRDRAAEACVAAPAGTSVGEAPRPGGAAQAGELSAPWTPSTSSTSAGNRTGPGAVDGDGEGLQGGRQGGVEQSRRDGTWPCRPDPARADDDQGP